MPNPIKPTTTRPTMPMAMNPMHYGSQVVNECADPVVWVIGSSVHGHLVGLDGLKCEGFIYQPNARNVDKEYNWDRLLDEVGRGN